MHILYTLKYLHYKNLNATHFFCLTSHKNILDSKCHKAFAEERVNHR